MKLINLFALTKVLTKPFRWTGSLVGEAVIWTKGLLESDYGVASIRRVIIAFSFLVMVYAVYKFYASDGQLSLPDYMFLAFSGIAVGMGFSLRGTNGTTKKDNEPEG